MQRRKRRWKPLKGGSRAAAELPSKPGCFSCANDTDGWEPFNCLEEEKKPKLRHQFIHRKRSEISGSVRRLASVET